MPEVEIGVEQEEEEEEEEEEEMPYGGLMCGVLVRQRGILFGWL
jgi:hypothetical protein